MRTFKLALALLAFGTVVGLTLIAQQIEGSGANMVSAAQGFVGKLTADQKKQAIYDFGSDERFNWNFVPLDDKAKKIYTRKGLPLAEMTAEQKKAALALVKAGTSESGNLAATTIMSLESILLDQEKQKGPIRNPEWYFFTVFGTPSKTGKWGWRVEGHHLSLNITMDGTQVVASTPCFFGANPAEVKSGPNKGKRILPQSEDYARSLFKSLTDDQKKVALQSKNFGEPGQKTKNPNLGKQVGVAASKMTKDQKDTLLKLITSYTERLPADIGAVELKTATDGGIDNVTFAFTGSTEGGKEGFTYRVQGSTFVIEFLNIQADSGGNPANHIHSCWRRIKGDFGL